MVLGDVAGLAERLGDRLRVARGILAPSRRGSRPSRCGRRRTAGCRARAACGRCGRPCAPASRNFLRSSSLAHRRAAAGRRPDRRDQRADDQTASRRSCRPAASGRRRSRRCRCADRRGTGRRRRTSRRPRTRRRSGRASCRARSAARCRALADEAGPHRVVQCGVFVGHGTARSFLESYDACSRCDPPVRASAAVQRRCSSSGSAPSSAAANRARAGTIQPARRWWQASSERTRTFRSDKQRPRSGRAKSPARAAALTLGQPRVGAPSEPGISSGQFHRAKHSW